MNVHSDLIINLFLFSFNFAAWKMVIAENPYDVADSPDTSK